MDKKAAKQSLKDLEMTNMKQPLLKNALSEDADNSLNQSMIEQKNQEKDLIDFK